MTERLHHPTARVDDRKHALLRRARSDHQAELGLFQDGASKRDEQRRVDPRLAGEVQEVTVKTALTRCALPGEPWSLNPYMGCAHDCVYCYVPDVAKVERERWGSYVVVKRNLPTVLAKELKAKEPRPVFLSSATDPYQPAEGVYEVTRRSLRLLQRSGWPVRVLTRSPLVRRDLDLLTRIEDLKVGMSVPTLDESARRVIEPGAPPIKGRLETLRALADAGLEPFVNIAPAYPFTTFGPREFAAALKDAGVAQVLAGKWRYLKGVLPALRHYADGSSYAEFEAVVQDETYYDRMFRSLRAAFEREGIPFRVMGDPSRDPTWQTLEA